MKLYTFMGNSPAEALQKAQEVCGKDALVVSTKQLKKKTLSSPALHEIVVALEEQKRDKNLKDNSLVSDNILQELSNQAKELSKKTKPPKEELSKLQQALERDSKGVYDKEIENLNQKLDTLTSLIQTLNIQKREDLTLPPEFATIYKELNSSGMEAFHIDMIIKKAIKEMPIYMKNSSATIKRYFQVLLAKMIPIRSEKLFLENQKKVMMLVGPTGVGKTTTLAKLAARYSMEFRKKVGIITLDSYRIGAVEQLYTYAKMMKLPIESAMDEYDFKKIVESLEYCDIILIDTIGSSQYDRDKLSKLASIYQKSNKKIDISLVLSASTKYEDLLDIYENFSILELDNAIITKFDESKTFGNIFSSLMTNSLPLSYFSYGQEVPDDLMCASSNFLVETLFAGFDKKEIADVK